ncbi:helix-turn-helix transcriptional regulator [Maribacter polysiphoniae]|uniref:DNA-binding XRE family transcriptional regulator n=1 Tax=Maribacter polysiphoniae TaxID=429344 RepID=A0A316E4E4_9FLAO|nr:helix-turn-helix transcriptional regulator [Maribacter polysiphoniae]MBD1259820.1 helix-turn-helix transcriptional regulator [Maribacter polysiphoniae]PWK25274.1 DNA-binding XRE family transcriptional regulator [Maribacter polysiphoniae]
METKTKNNHLGRKIGRIRELRGMKQETLAEELGISQQAISNIENSQKVDDAKLEEIAKALGVTKEGIENFSEEAILNIIGNTYHVDNSSAVNYGCTFNPLDKLMDAYEENRKLYERLLQAEKDKVTFMEKRLKKN